ncbi:biotin transport system substrate-specific component [Thermostichus sp. MS-CIW-21]|jgi:biotin transport system substrate-specific component|uniref:biotin transporter BioY n=1 Tax=unclassified Synechococcus TaxID=2626047 RepID=UPI00006948E8|nr:MULTISPECIES: biotin transporter BioY [unclassified Synechococcus]PIK95417.1 biotin carboxyl carrier protein [Synechococcus sp. 60AY4M2]ABD00871.1 BioY family protein [Synechococcus sp. JA-3-3Ab]PIK86353.1 biotin carboxyl carrier protein [Synechococcus sp. 63AY4M2]PIK89591.1 biotin carboxyl carrier protein [Synechococcus sp. 65AY6A5]PIK91714.1 biotin carboxyl carrier protein [Synechococcus sp. 65AY6Li]
MRSGRLLTPLEWLWIAIGVILTILGTLTQVSLPPQWPGVGGYSFSLQIGGVLLTACLAGPVAAVCAQIVYLGLGLAGLQVFAQGGGWQYLYQPAFGYLLGFLPAAWACGTMAFRQTDPHLPRASFPPRRNPYVQPSLSAPVRLQDLAAAGLVALTLVHLTGITYLLATQPWNGELLQLLRLYSGYTLPGQLIVVSFAALLALILRRLLLL